MGVFSGCVSFSSPFCLSYCSTKLGDTAYTSLFAQPLIGALIDEEQWVLYVLSPNNILTPLSQINCSWPVAYQAKRFRIVKSMIKEKNSSSDQATLQVRLSGHT